MTLSDKIVAIHSSLAAVGIDHAVGGAIALAYCIGEPRATVDVDINVFVQPAGAALVFDALPPQISTEEDAASVVARDGQIRLWWDDTPVDLFFAYHEFHAVTAARVNTRPFADRTIPVLSCTDLAVFKAIFDRPKDWVDIANMAESDSFDIDEAHAWLSSMLGDDDHRLGRLLRIVNGSADPRDFGLQ